MSEIILRHAKISFLFACIFCVGCIGLAALEVGNEKAEKIRTEVVLKIYDQAYDKGNKQGYNQGVRDAIQIILLDPISPIQPQKPRMLPEVQSQLPLRQM